MVMTMGTGKLTYKVAEGWGQLPEGWLLGDVGGVRVDSKDRLFAFTRGERPVVVFDRNGKYLYDFGRGEFVGTHGIHIGPDDSVYCIDTGGHQIKKFTPEGKLLMTMHSEAPRFSQRPFNRPSHLAISPVTGEIYISDGYGNGSIHKYSPDGKRLLLSWGAPGVRQGQFVVPHNIVVDKSDTVYVADRENHRLQVFDNKGKPQAMWYDFWRPAGLDIDKTGNIYVAEMPPPRYIEDAPGVGHRISIMNREGKLLARMGAPEPGQEAGHFTAPHGICVDSHGDIYVAEMPKANLSPEWIADALKKPNKLRPGEVLTLQKLVKQA